MNKRAIFFSICTVVLMVIIFLFSAQTNKETMETSDIIVKPIETSIKNNNSITFNDPQEKEDYFTKLKGKLDKAVRKSAHVFLYALLAICAYNALRGFGLTPIDAMTLTLVFCGLYAGSDEWHQHTMSDRDGKFSDVCIDLFGTSSALVLIRLCSIIYSKIQPRIHKKGNDL